MTERSIVKKDKVQMVGPKRQKDLMSSRTEFYVVGPKWQKDLMSRRTEFLVVGQK